MKTATSFVIPVVVASVLDERFAVHIAHGNVAESFQEVIDVARRFVARDAWRRWSAACLELAMEMVADVDHCFVVSNMPKALAE
jgi:hypothetical protein